MLEYQKKKKWQDVLYTRPVLILLIIVALFMLKATIGVYSKKMRSEENLVRTNKELSDLKNKVDLLNSDITKLQTEQGIEDEIRQKFRVTKGDEHLVVVVDRENNNTDSQTLHSLGLWSRIVNFFKQ